MPLLTTSSSSSLAVLKFLSVVHTKAPKQSTENKKNNSYFLQVLDPYQDQDEESAVVVMEESDKKSAQDMVIVGPLPLPKTFQTFAI